MGRSGLARRDFPRRIWSKSRRNLLGLAGRRLLLCSGLAILFRIISLVEDRKTRFRGNLFTSWRLQSDTSSISFFLCFGGFVRLSGITRSVRGVPMAKRARRRASLAARNFFGLRGGLNGATSLVDYILGLSTAGVLPALSTKK